MEDKGWISFIRNQRKWSGKKGKKLEGDKARRGNRKEKAEEVLFR